MNGRNISCLPLISTSPTLRAREGMYSRKECFSPSPPLLPFLERSISLPGGPDAARLHCAEHRHHAEEDRDQAHPEGRVARPQIPVLYHRRGHLCDVRENDNLRDRLSWRLRCPHLRFLSLSLLDRSLISDDGKHGRSWQGLFFSPAHMALAKRSRGITLLLRERTKDGGTSKHKRACLCIVRHGTTRRQHSTELDGKR